VTDAVGPYEGIVGRHPNNVTVLSRSGVHKRIQTGPNAFPWLSNKLTFSLQCGASGIVSDNDIIYAGSAIGDQLTEATYVEIGAEPNLGEQDSFCMFDVGPNCSANAANGNVNFSLPLFSSRGRGISTSFSLVYNSQAFDNSSIGQGWQHNYHIYLTGSAFWWDGPYQRRLPGNIRLNLGDGRKIEFTQAMSPGPIQYIALPEYGYFSRIVPYYPGNEFELPEGWFVMIGKYGMKYYFDDKGKLRKIKDLNGNAQDLSYNASGLLSSIVDSVNRTTTLAYDQQNHLATVTDPDNKTYGLGYPDGWFENVTFPSVEGVVPTWRFSYYLETLPVEDNSALDYPYFTRVNLLAEIYTPRGKIGDQSGRYSTKLFYLPDNRFRRSKDPYDYPRHVHYQNATNPFLLWTSPQNVELNTSEAIFFDRLGNQTKIEYDAIRSLARKVTDALGKYILREFSLPPVWFYQPYRNVTAFTDKEGNKTEYTYWYEDQPIFEGDYVRDNVKTIHRPETPGNNKIEYEYYPDSTNQNERWKRNRVKFMTEARRLNGTSLIQTEYFYDDKGDLTEIYYPDPDTGSPSSAIKQVYTYDSYGRVLTSTNPEGKITTYEYNDSQTGLVTSITRPGLASEQYTYNRMGSTLSRTLPEGGTTNYELDNLYRVTATLEPPDAQSNRARTEYTYDADSNLLTTTDPKTRVTTHTYNRLGRLTQTENPAGDTASTEYDANGNVRFSTDYRGNTTEYTYTALNQVKTEELPGLDTRTYWYTDNGNLLTETIGAKTVSSHVYDGRNNLKKTTYATSGITDQNYMDDNDNVFCSIRRDGTTFKYGSFYIFDARNRTASMIELTSDPGSNIWPGMEIAGGNTTAFTYDKNSNRTEVEDPLGNVTRCVLDDNDRLIETYDALNRRTSELKYDDNGNRTEVKVPRPGGTDLIRSQSFTYADNNQLKAARDAFDNETTYEYDRNGNMTRKTDAEGNSVRYFYNELNQLVRMEEDAGGGLGTLTTSYEYDENGNRTKVTDPRGKDYLYEYDSLNRLAIVTNPLITKEYYTYDGDGTLKTHKDANGLVTAYGYDGMFRLTSEDRPGTLSDIIREYDGANNLTRIRFSDNSVETRYTYNNLNQLTQVDWYMSQTLFKTISYAYDECGNRTTANFQSNQSDSSYLSYSYDKNNRPTTITRDSTTYATFGYDTAGRRMEMALANGVTARYNYDQAERLTNLRWEKSGGGLAASFRYEYDKVSNRTAMTLEHLGARFEYGYNGVYWLTSETSVGNGSPLPYTNQFVDIPGGNESAFSNEVTAIPAAPALAVPAYVYEWGYDKAGNRVNKDCTSGQAIFGESTYVYDDENRLTVETTDDGDIEYGYDNNGNTIQKRKVWNNEIESYGYDYANRMNSYTNAQSDVWSYVFAPTGERLAKLNPDGSEEWFAYDGPDVIADYTRSGSGQPLTWASSYVQGMGIDSKIARITTINSQPATLYYVGDALNSVHKIVDGNQATVNTTISNAWGEEIVSSQSLPDRHGFTQREKDNESALQYSRARMYSPRLGRFASTDPLQNSRWKEQYVYCHNNPAGLKDPQGLTPWTDKITTKKAVEILQDLGYLSKAYQYNEALEESKEEWLADKALKGATEALQTRLNEEGYAVGDVDGKWGIMTQAGWDIRQTDKDVAATRGNWETEFTQKAMADRALSETQMLANALFAEFVGEGNQIFCNAATAAAWIFRNRAENLTNEKEFRKLGTYTRVITQPSAVTSYSKKTAEWSLFNNKPGLIEQAASSNYRTVDNYKSAWNIAIGVVRSRAEVNPFPNALWYYSPKHMKPPGSTPDWSDFSALMEVPVPGLDATNDVIRVLRRQ
jgi:RHS repeat-associated protein